MDQTTSDGSKSLESANISPDRFRRRFDAASAHVNLNLTGKILKPPNGTIVNISFLSERREERVRGQDQRSDRKALGDDAKRAIMMDMRSFELERHLVLSSGRYDTEPKINSALRDYVEQMHHTSVVLGIIETAHPAEHKHEGY